MAAKRSLDDLDDDDLALIGRAQRGDTPWRRVRVVGGLAGCALGGVVGVFVGPAVGFCVLAPALVALFSRAGADCAADLKDAGFDDALAEEVGAAAADRANSPFNADAFKVVPHLFLPQRELVRLGQKVVDEVRRRRAAALR